MFRSRIVLVVCAAAVLSIAERPNARQAATRVPVAMEEALAVDPPAQEAAWSFADLGEDIGSVALFAARNGTRTEIIGAGRFHWYVHDYDPVGKRLRLLYFSPTFRFVNEIVGIAVARRAGGNEILVAMRDGNVMRYDHATRQFLGQEPSLCVGHGEPLSFAVADLYGNDGIDEHMFLCWDKALVVGGAGYATWTLADQAQFAWGGEIVAGQLDADAAIEIVVNKGAIIDSGTHLVQWLLPPGSACCTNKAYFRIGDLDGNGLNELVFGRPADPIRVYDVGAQTVLRSFTPAGADVHTIELADVNSNGSLELIIGDAQWGPVRVFNPVTFAQIGTIANQEHGVTHMATFDADNDGISEIVWGAGASSTGPDHLYLGKWAAGTIVWESTQLDGPFVGPVAGDVDGDGRVEIVAASHTAEAGHGVGRIVVFNGKTLAVRALSPFTPFPSFRWVWDLKLRDINGDGRLEILLASGQPYDGVIEAYRFTPPAQFDLVWTNTARPYGAAFGAVEVADLDGDGVAEVLGATRTEHTGSEGTFIYAYDLATGAQKWRVPINGVPQFTDIESLIVSTFGVTGKPKALALLRGHGVAVVEGLTKTHTATFHTDATWIGMLGSAKLLVGDTGGEITSYRLLKGLFTAQTTRTFLTGRVEGARLKSDFSGWVAGSGVLRYFDSLGTVLTKSAYYSGVWGDEPFGRSIHLVGGNLDMALTSGASGVHGIKIPVVP